MLLLRLWRAQPGSYFCISTKSASGKWRDQFFKRAELSQVANYIERNKDKDVYFCPHGFSEPRRTEEASVTPSLMWADLDEADPRQIAIRPTIAIESSPGRYVGLWILRDKLDKKETNQALNYYIGADKGGWGFSKVLRVPGTTNYKYQAMPRVRTLWIDGPSYSLAEIKKKLPSKREESTEDAEEVYRRYERKMKPWLRRELLDGKPTQGKRSEMIWKMNNELLELGASTEEVFTLLRASPWNKFKGRDEQLRKDIERSSGKKIKHESSRPNGHSDYKFLQRSIEDVEEEEIDWIWYPYIARGELSILEGDPGVGKSYLAQMMCASIADGVRLPSVKRLPAVTGKIAYFDIENSAGSVTKKRLSYNSCSNMQNYYQEEEPFSIDDTDKLDEVFEAIEHLKPTVVVFDTINTYIGKADTYKASETQQAFAIFREIAKRFNCAVLVLRHLTKGKTDQKALYRGQGSIAFAGLARVVMTVGMMPDEDDVRVMTVTKINVARPPKGLTFSIIEIPDTLKEKDRSRFDWGQFVDITSDDIVSAPVQKGKERSDAKEWLSDQLASGAVSAKQLERNAEAHSISWRTLQRAADELGVQRSVKGFGPEKRSMWTLRAGQKKSAPIKERSRSREARN